MQTQCTRLSQVRVQQPGDPSGSKWHRDLDSRAAMEE
jgi:hypothetical protein